MIIHRGRDEVDSPRRGDERRIPLVDPTGKRAVVTRTAFVSGALLVAVAGIGLPYAVLSGNPVAQTNVPAATTGRWLYRDLDCDRTKDDNEPLAASVAIELTDQQNRVVATTATDHLGRFGFTQLAEPQQWTLIARIPPKFVDEDEPPPPPTCFTMSPTVSSVSIKVAVLEETETEN